MQYILIILVISGYSGNDEGVSVSTQVFRSQSACESAKEMVLASKVFKKSRYKADVLCVPNAP